jgi:hypothetical protein
MEKVTYKYNVGDTVQFKSKFGPTASCGLKELAGKSAKIIECRDYNKACYKLESIEGYFTEGCFVGIKED